MKRENNIKCSVYVGMVVDLLHEGHMLILKYASSLGDVMVGLLPQMNVWKCIKDDLYNPGKTEKQ